MNIVVDANILFSALITPNGKLAKILSYPMLPARLISGHLLIAELTRHQAKIIRYAKRSEESVLDDLHFFLKNIQLYDENFIQPHNWLEAERLTKEVDNFDISYVALALQTKGILWTGDKKLITHLQEMQFENIADTNSLHQLLNID